MVIDNQFYDDLFMTNFEIVYAFISIIIIKNRKSKVVSCSRLLSLRMTDDGFCCSIDVGVYDREVYNRY